MSWMTAASLATSVFALAKRPGGHRNRRTGTFISDECGGAGRRPPERSLPRLGARNFWPRDLKFEGRALADSVGRFAQQIFLAVGEGDGVAAVAPDVDQLRLNDSAGADHAFDGDSGLDDFVIFDEGAAHLADPPLDQPIRQARSRRCPAARASRRAAGRRRWNSCRRYGGRRLRHSPGGRSRRPCRATPRGSHNSRFPPR